MCVANKLFQTFLFVILNLAYTSAAPTAPAIRENVVEVPIGNTVTLLCQSNDENHVFHYWYFDGTNAVIVGPSNNYDIGKYRYQILTGNLTIKAVTKHEEGVYYCVSRGVHKNDINIRKVRMVIEENWEEVYEHNPNVNLYRVLIAFATLVILAGIGYVAYTVWKNRFRQPSYLGHSDDDDNSDDELFRVPGVPRSTQPIVKTTSLESLETPGISTDFNSILYTANNK